MLEVESKVYCKLFISNSAALLRAGNCHLCQFCSYLMHCLFSSSCTVHAMFENCTLMLEIRFHMPLNELSLAHVVFLHPLYLGYYMLCPKTGLVKYDVFNLPPLFLMFSLCLGTNIKVTQCGPFTK